MHPTFCALTAALFTSIAATAFPVLTHADEQPTALQKISKAQRLAYCVQIQTRSSVRDRNHGTLMGTLPAGAPVRIGEIDGSWVQISYTPGQKIADCDASEKLAKTGWVGTRNLSGIHKIADQFIPVMGNSKPLIEVEDETETTPELNCGVAPGRFTYAEDKIAQFNPEGGNCTNVPKEHKNCGNVDPDHFAVYFSANEKTPSFLLTIQPQNRAMPVTVYEFSPRLPGIAQAGGDNGFLHTERNCAETGAFTESLDKQGYHAERDFSWSRATLEVTPGNGDRARTRIHLDHVLTAAIARPINLRTLSNTKSSSTQKGKKESRAKAIAAGKMVTLKRGSEIKVEYLTGDGQEAILASPGGEQGTVPLSFLFRQPWVDWDAGSQSTIDQYRSASDGE